jgi:hypothetical protein
MATKRVFKTKKKLSGGRAEYRPWRDWSVGDIVIGKYKGSKIDNYEKPNWLIEVVDAQFSKKKDGDKLVGKVLGLNSAGQLDKAMEGVNEGEMIQVHYVGTSTIEKGKYKGKDAHQIEVDIVVEEGDEDEDDMMEEDEDSDEL